MKLKAAVKYQLWESRMSVSIYYCCVLALFALVAVLSPNMGNVSGGNIEWITAIFLFIAGIATFSSSFKMYLQNGLSRSLLSKSVFLTFLLGSLIMLAGDALVQAIFMMTPINFSSSIDLAYPSFGTVSRWLLHYGLLFFTSCLGYFIGVFFYRLNKLLRVLFSVLLPILSINLMANFGMAYMAENFKHSKVTLALEQFSTYISQTPIHLGVFLLFLGAIFAALSHLLTRKAYLK